MPESKFTLYVLCKLNDDDDDDDDEIEVGLIAFCVLEFRRSFGLLTRREHNYFFVVF